MVRYKKLYTDSIVPEFQSDGAKARDLHVHLGHRQVVQYTRYNYSDPLQLYGGSELILPPGYRVLVPTGIAIALPEDCEALISLRSSAIKKGIIMVNSPGIVDSDYRGELFVPICNISDAIVTLLHAERFAQIRVRRVEEVPWVEGELDETVRGEAGFGSTGR